MDTDYDSQLPPPAYSEQQEFDQKVSLATEISILSTSPGIDEDGWEQYDPSLFEGSNPVNVTGGITRQNIGNPITAPLRLEKKKLPKEYGRTPDITHNESNIYMARGHQFDHHYPAAPGSSYLQSHHPEKTIARCNAKTSPTSQTFLESNPNEIYNAEKNYYQLSASVYGKMAESTPSSNPENYQNVSDKSTAKSRRVRALPSLPITPSKQQLVYEERPRSTPDFHREPIVRFDASMAYNRSALASSPHNQLVSSRSDIQYDPHSLYNSAVSAQLNPVRGVQADRLSTPRPKNSNYVSQLANTQDSNIMYSTPNASRHSASDITRSSHYFGGPL